MTYYVERREGAIVGAYRVPQPGVADEPVAGDDPELVAFFGGPSETERLNAVRAAALMGLLTRSDEIGIAVRAVLAGLSSGINNRLETIDAQLRALGQPGIPAPVRVLDTEVLAYLSANPTAGDPLPSPP